MYVRPAGSSDGAAVAVPGGPLLGLSPATPTPATPNAASSTPVAVDPSISWRLRLRTLAPFIAGSYAP
ncbi:hypothetical protein GCM10022225_09340 [Plantactinospora mayteni]|uniref:Uncharacterized protein n=1 Tax=Plantactinospora mayteni TaxID=566021 RepID=A0ABQ4EHX8_9ACTN|nr:hypothetical protein Pma05_08920 [Plantactinospora mayteni]